MNPIEWIDREVLGNSLLLWAASVSIFLVAWIVLGTLRRVLRERLHRLAEGRDLATLHVAADAVSDTRSWFVILLSLLVGSLVLNLPDDIEGHLGQIATLVLLVQAGLWASAIATKLIEIRREDELEDNPGAVAAMDLLSLAVRVGVWSVILLIMLDNYGVNVTTLIAGLGVGGIAVALAAQNILGDLFASLSIVLDKPFVVGDFLIIGDYLGAVEKVGIKTTRVRSLSGEQLIFSNNDLLNSRIRNYGRMFERRVVFSVGVTYQTTSDQLREIPVILREAVQAREGVRFDRAHFQKYGDFALIFEIVYYVLSPDYNKYMDIQQAINLQIFERFAERSIEFAYPTQTVHLNRED